VVVQPCLCSRTDNATKTLHDTLRQSLSWTIIALSDLAWGRNPARGRTARHQTSGTPPPPTPTPGAAAGVTMTPPSWTLATLA